MTMIATNLSQRNHLKCRQMFIHEDVYWVICGNEVLEIT